MNKFLFKSMTRKFSSNYKTLLKNKKFLFSNKKNNKILAKQIQERFKEILYNT